MSKQKQKPGQGRHAKTDVRYWEKAVFQPTYTRDGETRVVGEWSAKIQHLGRRETFQLGSANKTAAASKAKEIFLSLQSSGWEPTLAKHKPKSGSARKPVATLGEFVAEVKSKATCRAKTVEGYCRALRTIAADIFNIDGGKAKFDYRKGGRAKWLARVEAIKLADVTPELVQKWKVRFLARAAGDPVKQRAARISVNSMMRQAKNLFSDGVLKFITLEVPSVLPFNGVSFEKRQSMRYRSTFDVEVVIKDALAQLPVEQLKIFLLAVMVGLRRNEIDKLEWSSFQWTAGTIRIETTSALQPKSEDSHGDIEVDAELMAIFRVYHSKANGSFVIESKNPVRPNATFSHYRAEKEFTALLTWLRVHGVVSLKPLHTLRKEYGSQICAKHGIFAASHALRHAEIKTTAAHYLEAKDRVTFGMGHLISGKPKPRSGAKRRRR